MEKLFKITLRNDYAFKLSFRSGRKWDVLQDLLECILDIPPETASNGLELLDKEFHKDSISDTNRSLRRKITPKEQHNYRHRNSKQVEQRVRSKNNLYWAKMYTENLKTGRNIYKIA